MESNNAAISQKEPFAGPFFYHAYSSTAAKTFNQADLLELLHKSRENNTRRGLTGMLLYKHGDFMQVLEGPEAIVREVLKTIRADPRHHSMALLLEGYAPERQFPEWSMGFNDLDSAEAQATLGYSEFLNTPLNAGLAKDPNVCQRLLHLFKKRPR